MHSNVVNKHLLVNSNVLPLKPTRGHYKTAAEQVINKAGEECDLTAHVLGEEHREEG